MSITISHKSREMSVGKGYYGRQYQVYFKSKGNTSADEGAVIPEYSLEWHFVDRNLDFPLDIRLTELIQGGMTEVIARVRFKKITSRVAKIDQYVSSELEQFARDGRVKL